MSTLHASTGMVALLTAANWLPWLLLGLPAGTWVDRWPILEQQLIPHQRVAQQLHRIVYLGPVDLAQTRQEPFCKAGIHRSR